MGGEPILTVEGVRRDFQHRGGSRTALEDVSFKLHERKTLAVVGESGAGKSTLARLIAGLDTPTAGSIRVRGSQPKIRPGTLSPVQMVFQQPKEALNPFLSVGRSIAEPIRRLPKSERNGRVAQAMERVGLAPDRAGWRPSRFSGGQLQRIVIARALTAQPSVLLCDEPTSALDVSVAAQIINLILELQASDGFACLLVTHDLSVVRTLADEVLVLRGGRVVEHGVADGFFAGPKHEYSRALLESVALHDPRTHRVGVE